ncbi:hypothetical protein [Clostridium botulinum]|uniref:hypothetical protein n=1 Tax=Clostridium botulinum TaxID=1491 RepID=UPI003A7FCC93
MAIELLQKAANCENNPDVVASTSDIKYKNGKKYIFVMLKSKKLVESGGTGTIECGYIAKDGSRCIYTDF